MSKKQDPKILVEQFAEGAEKSFEAMMKGDWRENNKWVKRQIKAFQEITAIGDAAREELLTLLEHENLRVASAAATFSLKYATEKSIATLERVAQEPGMIGFGAQQALQRWKEGSWQLE